MKTTRKILSSAWSIHFFVVLGLFALLGYLVDDNDLLIFFCVLSFAGAICGSFIKVVDTINKHNQRK